MTEIDPTSYPEPPLRWWLEGENSKFLFLRSKISKIIVYGWKQDEKIEKSKDRGLSHKSARAPTDRSSRPLSDVGCWTSWTGREMYMYNSSMYTIAIVYEGNQVLLSHCCCTTVVVAARYTEL